MEKKIKDLTVEERRKNFCNKVDRCYFCPLMIITADEECWCKFDLLTEYGNEEIEVNEND